MAAGTRSLSYKTSAVDETLIRHSLMEFVPLWRGAPFHRLVLWEFFFIFRDEDLEYRRSGHRRNDPSGCWKAHPPLADGVDSTLA